MELQDPKRIAEALFFAILLLIAVFWIAIRRGFFRLPPYIPEKKEGVSILQTVGAFLTYLLIGIVALPLIHFFLVYLDTGEIGRGATLAPFWKGWLHLIAIGIIFVFLIIYCFFIRPSSRALIFWGKREVSWHRFLKSAGMGIMAWIVSYPFVLLMSLVASLISIWIWGEAQIEQVAVKQLKGTQGHALLFVLMIFAVVVLVPFMEELLFRGFFQNLLKRYFGRWWAIIVTAFVFALVHFSPTQGVGNFQLILSLCVLSFFLGFIYERERTLWAPTALHMTFNGVSVIFIVLT